MNIKIIDKNGVTLKTKGKYCKEDISVAVDDSLIGITPSGTYQVTDNGEYDITEYAKVNVNVAGSGGESTLKKLLDHSKSCKNMFAENTYITDLTDYLSYNDTQNVINTYRMFYKCTKLQSVPSLNLTETTSTQDMFTGCYMLKTVGKLVFSKVAALSYMFHNCYSLKSVVLDTTGVNSMNSTFYYCSALEKVDISFYNVSTTDDSNNTFADCSKLKTVIIRGFGTSYTLNSNTFNYCYHILGKVDETYNPTGAKDGYIYVPKNMVDTLKNATNWSKYADQIRALEDYTVDGTTTGELDESKI